MKTSIKIARSINKLLSQVSDAAASMTDEQRQTLLDNINRQFAFVPATVPAPTQELTLRPSSLVQTATYNTNTQELTVTLAGNRSYIYQNVPTAAAVGMTSAESVGAFFNQNIRSKFDWAEV